MQNASLPCASKYILVVFSSRETKKKEPSNHVIQSFPSNVPTRKYRPVSDKRTIAINSLFGWIIILYRTEDVQKTFPYEHSPSENTNLKPAQWSVAMHFHPKETFSNKRRLLGSYVHNISSRLFVFQCGNCAKSAAFWIEVTKNLHILSYKLKWGIKGMFVCSQA